MRDRRWRYQWQVIRADRGAVTVLCSHRWEATAGGCASRRDFADLLFRPRSVAYYDVRPNAYMREVRHG